MDQEYDAIVLGTGLKECILSGVLSVEGMKVLHMDRNDYYGGECASLNLIQLFEKFKDGQKPPQTLGANRDYNVDLTPKFLMAHGNLVKALVHTQVTKYLEFKAVDGSYVYKSGKIYKAPATDYEALTSPLLGLLEKNRLRQFFRYVQDYDENNPRTQKYDVKKLTSQEFYKIYNLDKSTQDVVGHAIALYVNDEYLSYPAIDMVRKIKLYYNSLTRFEKMGAPYIYPVYGLGELPQSFARLSSVYGGTYMLNKPEVEVVYSDEGVAIGVRAKDEEDKLQVAKAKYVIGDPSYFPKKVQKAYQVVRVICILSHPIPNTDNSKSCQIIIPASQVQRKSDIYIFVCSYEHNVCAQGKFIASISTTVETSDPKKEVNPGLALLGPVDEYFIDIGDVMEPVDNGIGSKAFISKGYDAVSHFETTVDDVFDLYTRITGKVLNVEGEKSDELNEQS